MVSLRSLLVLLPALGVVCARQLSNGRFHANAPPVPAAPPISAPEQVVTHAVTGEALPPFNTTYYFDQLIDHTNPSLGTFKQRFYHTWQWYEEGGPIILFTPGEAAFDGYDGYLTNVTINGQVAQQEHGATIVLEHRYYGLSTPTPDLSAPNLKFHTIQQAIDDLEYFAKNVKLAMPGGDSVGPTEAPWVLIGGSYSGALTSWTMVNKPDLFRAGYASSAVVEAITTFWQYFEPIRQNMPQNCSADVEAAIAQIDHVFTTGSKSQIQALKESFGMGNLTHLDDIAGALRSNLWDWQSLSPDTGSEGAFFKFCDALEVKDGQIAPASGFGADHAVQAWAAYWKNGYLKEICGTDIEDCIDTYNPKNSLYTDDTIGNDGRSWTWIVCNEVGFYQEGTPANQPSLITRLVQPSYDERQCTYYFPQKFPKGTLPQPNVLKTNLAYDGWNVHIDRLFFANGKRDPWRYATTAADGTTAKSTPQQPVTISDGFHCSDLITANAKVDPTVLSVQQQGLQAIHEFLQGFKPAKRDLERRVTRAEYERGCSVANAESWC